MPWWDFLQPIGSGIKRVGRQVGQIDDPATLEQIRKYLPPGINGERNPATQPRPVAPSATGTGRLTADWQPEFDAPRGLPPVNGRGRLTADYRPEFDKLPNDLYSAQAADRPPAMVNRPRPRLPAPGPSPIPGGELPRPAMLDREMSPPTKSYGHERLDYRDQNAGRGFKQSVRAGLRGGLESLRTGQGGGFLGGMLGNLIDPQGEADRQFAAGPGRRILQRQEMERGDELYGLKVRGLEASAAENEAQAERYRKGTYKDAPFGTYNDVTGQLGYERPVVLPRPITPKWEWVTGPDGKPRQVNVNDPSYKPDGLQPYNKPGAPGRMQPISENAPYVYNPTTQKYEPNPGYRPKDGTQRVSPAEERMRTKEITGEVSRHNAMRKRLVELGNMLARTPKDDKDYAGRVDAYNADKQEFDAESQRLQDTYGDDLENQDSSGAWPLFKVKARAAQPGVARPAARGNNADAELIKRIQANPEAWAAKARAKGHTEEEIQKALRAAGVK